PATARPLSCPRHRKFSRPIHCGRLPPAAVGELTFGGASARSRPRDFLALFFLCDLSGRGLRRFFPHAEDAKGAKAEAEAQWRGRPPRRIRRSWLEIILRDEPWIAEPEHWSQRREAFRVCREFAGCSSLLDRRGSVR